MSDNEAKTVTRSDYEKIRNLESVAVCSITFQLPWYTIVKLSDRVIPSRKRSSEITCKIDVIIGEDVGTKIEYIPWHERYGLRVPLVHYFAYMFDKDDINDAFLMLESMRILDYILSDLGIIRKPEKGHEGYRGWAFDILNAIKEGLKNGEVNDSATQAHSEK